MAQENTREQRLKYAFAAHISVLLFYVTSDDQMFIQKTDADNHAATLSDKEVFEAHRRDYVDKATEKVSEETVFDKASLFKKYEELFGKQPAKNAKLETVQAKVTAEVARLESEKSAASVGAGAGSSDDANAGSSDEEE